MCGRTIASLVALMDFLPRKARRTLFLTLFFICTLALVVFSNRAVFLKHSYRLQYLRRNPSVSNQWDEYRAWLEGLSQKSAAFDQIPYTEEAFFDPLLNLVGTLHFSSCHQYQRQPYVSNGYIGARIPNLGQGFAVDDISGIAGSTNTLNGWPLFNRRFAGAFVAGFYDLQPNTTGTNFPWLLQYGGESIISVVPQWTSLALSLAGKTLDPRLNESEWGLIEQYSQTLSMDNGVVTTLFLWLGKFYVQYKVSANRASSSVGTVSLSVTNPSSLALNVLVINELNFDTALRLTLLGQIRDENGISQFYTPEGVDAFGATYATLKYDRRLELSVTNSQNKTKISQTVVLSIPARSEVDIVKVVGMVTSDLNPQKYNSAETVLQAAKDECLSSTVADLEELNNSQWLLVLGSSLAITFPDDPLLTLASRASIYHLLANTRADAEGLTAALGVAGLSLDSYGGMVFWDTDLWMLSALLPYAPQHSHSLVNYRLSTHAQAQKNLDSPLNNLGILKGAVYPWTSGRYGNCTATGPCFNYEYHLNSAIVLSAWKLYLSGSVDESYLEDVAFPIISDAALFLSDYVQYNDTLQKYTTRNLTDPDEYANHIDNGAYTNAAIVSTMNIAMAVYSHLGKKAPDLFAKIAENMYIPRSPDDNNIVLEYSGMPASVEVKQADVVMLTYPLEYGLDETAAAKNLQYYSSKQSRFGPAMTWPIFSAVSSVILDGGCSSQSYLVKAVKPFLRGPYAQFLEQNNDEYDTNGGTHPAFPFLTASGGFVQAVHGLLGLRFDYDVQNGTVFRFLRFDAAQLANLPNGLFVDGIRYMNLTLSARLDDQGLNITNHGPEEGANAADTTLHIRNGVRLGDNSYDIPLGGTAHVPIYSLKSTVENSLTECRSSVIANITQGVAGDVLLLINDGDNSTYWQAKTAGTSQILVDLLSNKTIKGGFINWGDTPASFVSIKTPTEKFYAHSPAFDLVSAILTNISFIDHLRISAGSAFQVIYSTNVTITEPYNEENRQKVILQDSRNVTSFSFSNIYKSRFILVEFSGILSPGEGGAKICDLHFV